MSRHKASPDAFNRSRARFKSWLIGCLNQQGAGLPPRPSFEQLKEAIERYFIAKLP